MSKAHKHTGKIDRHHLDPHPGKDPHAGATYHKNNAAHGMHKGISHDGDGDTDGSGDNCSYGKSSIYCGDCSDTAMSGTKSSGKTKNGGEGMAHNKA